MRPLRHALLPTLLPTLLPVLALAAAPARGQSAPAAAQQPPLPSVTLPPEVDRVLRDYERAWRARDADALAALFADDGYVLANGAPPRRGRAAIAEGYRGAGGPLFLRALGYSTADTVGFVIGAFRSDEGGADGGKFVLALRRGSATQPWRIAADIDNPIRRR
jgi:ketosteroid isomerase-like protein